MLTSWTPFFHIMNSQPRYSFVPNCKGRGRSNWKFWEEAPQVHLVIIKEWPKTRFSLILKNINNFPPSAFYSVPLQLTKE